MCYDTMYVNTQRKIISSKRPLCTTTSRDGLRAALGRYDGRVAIFDVSSEDPSKWKEVHAAEDVHENWVRSVCFSGDGGRVASGADDGCVVICNAFNGEQVHRLAGGHGDEAVRSVCFSPDGKRVASGGEDGRVVIWDISSEEPSNWRWLRALGGDEEKMVLSVCFSRDGKRVASGGSNGRVLIWDISSELPSKWKQVRALAGGHGGQWVGSVCFSGDGGRVASGGGDNRVVIWNISSEDPSEWKQVHALQGGNLGGGFATMCFSKDGTRVASVAYDRRVRIWDAVSGKQVQAMNGPKYYSVTFLGDTNDICCVSCCEYHFYVDVWRETEYRLTQLHGKEGDERDAQKPRSESSSSSMDIVNLDTFTDVFKFLEAEEQQNMVVAHTKIRRKLYIKSTNEVLTKKDGHWYIQTQLPRVIAADGNAAATADGGGAAVHLLRLRL